MMQKRISAEVKQKTIADLTDVSAMQMFDGGFCLTLRGAESTEIVFTDQVAGGRSHQRQIQRQVEPSGLAGKNRWCNRLIYQQVLIATLMRFKSRMKFFIDLFSPQHANSFGKQSVDATYPGAHRSQCQRIKMYDLRKCVYASIGSTSCDYPQRMICYASQCFLQAILQSTTCLLYTSDAAD